MEFDDGHHEHLCWRCQSIREVDEDGFCKVCNTRLECVVEDCHVSRDGVLTDFCHGHDVNDLEQDQGQSDE